MTHAALALQSHDLSGEGIKLWITYILFWPHKDMEGHSGWVISPMPGPPSRQHKHERQYTPSTHCHPNKANMEWWLRRPNDIRWLWGHIVSWHWSYRWGKNPEKTSTRKRVPTGDRTRARCVTSARATTCSTAVDSRNTFLTKHIRSWKIDILTSFQFTSQPLLSTALTVLHSPSPTIQARGWWILSAKGQCSPTVPLLT